MADAYNDMSIRFIVRKRYPNLFEVKSNYKVSELMNTNRFINAWETAR